MKHIKVGLLSTFLALSVSANPFEGVTEKDSKCFARTYTKQELAAHKLQTVKQMTVKLGRRMDLNIIDVRVLRTNNKRYKAALACNDEGSCWIDCDGGSATLKLAGNALQFTNNGFIMQGGCGEDEKEIIFLESKPGGDDVFLLSPSRCK